MFISNNKFGKDSYDPTDLMKSQEKMYAEFNNNLPKYADKMYGDAAATARNNLYNTNQEIKKNANSRGLLYSGLRQGAEGQAAASEASKLGSSVSDINDYLMNLKQNALDTASNTAMDRYKGQVGQAFNAYQQAMNEYGNKQRGLGNIIGLGGTVAGLGMAALSDETKKENISDGSDAVTELLETAKPYEYEYKDKSFGEGRHLSPMAQDLEKSRLGKSMVIETSQGKMVDYGKGFGAMLATSSSLHERLKKLEQNLENIFK